MAALAAPRPRRSWIAAVLTLLLPGLGQLYAGRPRRALLVLLMDTTWATYMLQLVLHLPEGRNLWLPAALYYGFRAIEVADAVWIARRADASPRWFQRWYVYLLCFLVLPPVQGLALTRASGTWRFTSRSMAPTVVPGDHVLTDRLTRTLPAPLMRVLGLDPGEPERGQIFVYLQGSGPEAHDFLFRIAGLPGETLESRDGRLLIDGVAVDEPYLNPEDGPQQDFGPVTVPAGCYFMLGDNRRGAADSRYQDEPFVPRSRLLARARVILMSEDPMTGEARWERCGRVLR